MKKTVKSEKTKMKRYIVEAPEPKQGQKVSSGGIRENGKLAAQFKNPVPYEEPTLPVTVEKPRVSRKDEFKRQARDLAWDCGSEILSCLWTDFLSPILQAKVHEFGVRAVNAIGENGRRSYDRSDSERMIDADPVEVTSNHNDVEDEKIIQFPGQRAV